MTPKSIYRRPDAQHFQLVHRSQRDPLIHHPDASQHVFKPFQRENEVKKGKSRADLESLLPSSDLAARDNVGEATLYGVYYDDTEYNYMQHLRDPGVEENGVEMLTIDAPAQRSKDKDKGKGKAHEGIQLRLPPEALPSSFELDRAQAYDAQQAVPDALAGFQPDMDLHLRQALEALEEDAFVDDELGDDFFDELVGDGERAPGEDVEFEFAEAGVEEGVRREGVRREDNGRDETREDEPWEVRFARFKKQQNDALPEDMTSETGGSSEGADTVGRLPVVGGKRRRRGAASELSGFSMTSSAVFRNEGLSTLDERYDQIERLYEDEEDVNSDEDEDDDEAPDLLEARDDFEAIMDDFLDNYELVGRRMQPVLPGDTATQKLDAIRRALGGMRINPGADGDEADEHDIPIPYDIDEKMDRWDCETILSTYTNLENHPRLIKARDDHPVRKIRLDHRTGLPSTEPSHHRQDPGHTEEEPESDDDGGHFSMQATVARPRNESKEEKRARKQAVKQDRQARRVDKKAKREQFSTERKHQVKAFVNKPLTAVKKL